MNPTPNAVPSPLPSSSPQVTYMNPSPTPKRPFLPNDENVQEAPGGPAKLAKPQQQPNAKRSTRRYRSKEEREFNANLSNEAKVAKVDESIARINLKQAQVVHLKREVEDLKAVNRETTQNIEKLDQDEVNEFTANRELGKNLRNVVKLLIDNKDPCGLRPEDPHHQCPLCTKVKKNLTPLLKYLEKQEADPRSNYSGMSNFILPSFDV